MIEPSMIDVRWPLLVGSALLATGCVQSARPEILCFAACSITPSSPAEETPMPEQRPAPVAMAVTFVPTDDRAGRVMKARDVVDMLNVEGAISLRPPVLVEDELSACGGEAEARISCLAAVATRGGPQAVAVVVEHPGWASINAQVTCVGPDPALAQVKRMILFSDVGSTPIVLEPLKASLADCLIGALGSPAQPK